MSKIPITVVQEKDGVEGIKGTYVADDIHDMGDAISFLMEYEPIGDDNVWIEIGREA